MDQFVTPSGIFSYTLQPVSSVSPRTRQSAPASPRRRTKARQMPPNMASPNGRQIQDDDEPELPAQAGFVDQDLELWVCRALNDEDISCCPPKLIPGLIDSLSKQWEFSIANGYYFQSEKAHTAFKNAQQLQKSANNRRLQKMIQENLEGRKSDTNTSLADLEASSEVHVQNMEIQFSQELEEMMEKHDRELKKFHKDWATVKKRLYNKPSAPLSEMRIQQEKMIDVHRFKESDQVSMAADKLEKVEISNKIINMEYDYKTALRSIIQRQREELRILRANQEDQRKLYFGAKKGEIDLINQRLKKIDQEFEKTIDIRTIQRRQIMYTRGPGSPPRYCSASFSRLHNKEVIVAEFNEVPLPPLNAAQRIQRELMKRSKGMSNFNFAQKIQEPPSPRARINQRLNETTLS